MDFLHRNANNQSQTTRPASNQTSSPTAGVNDTKKKLAHDEPRWLRVVYVGLLFSITILALAIAGLMYVGKDREASYVNTAQNQAVFLTNGQVYFGKIAAVSNDYVNLTDIYYLNSQQQESNATTQNQNQQTNFSLVKLGCELHGPADQMIINRDQVSFWENLKPDGKVAKAIEQFKSQNPNGQTCSDTTNSTDQSQPATTGTSSNKQQ